VLALRRLLEVLEALGLASKVLEAAIPKATATMRTILRETQDATLSGVIGKEYAKPREP